VGFPEAESIANIGTVVGRVTAFTGQLPEGVPQPTTLIFGLVDGDRLSLGADFSGPLLSELEPPLECSARTRRSSPRCSSPTATS